MALQRPYEQLCNSSTIAHIVVYTNLKVLHKVLLEALLKLYIRPLLSSRQQQ
jgi:hypothetical protein